MKKLILFLAILFILPLFAQEGGWGTKRPDLKDLWSVELPEDVPHGWVIYRDSVTGIFIGGSVDNLPEIQDLISQIGVSTSEYVREEVFNAWIEIIGNQINAGVLVDEAHSADIALLKQAVYGGDLDTLVLPATNFAAVADNDSAYVTLTWTNPTYSLFASDTMYLRITNTNSSGLVTGTPHILTTVAGNLTSYTVTTVKADSSYIFDSYRVRNRISNLSNPSGVVTVVDTTVSQSIPNAPSLLQVATTFGQATISWADNSDDEDHFRVQIANNLNFTTALFDTTVEDSTTLYVKDDMSPGSYYTRVRSENSDNQGSAWITSAVFVIPAIPSVADTLSNAVYVSTSGSDANNGSTWGTAISTLAKVQAWIDTMTVNRNFAFKYGDTWTDRSGTYGLWIQRIKGTANNNIIFGAYGDSSSGKPIFDFTGTNPSIYIAGGNATLLPQYITFRNIYLKATGSTIPTSGFRLAGNIDSTTSPQYITFESCEVEGVVTAFSLGYACNNITISDNYVHSLGGGQAVVGASYNVTIEDNVFSGTTAGSSSTIYANNGSLPYTLACSGWSIKDNEITGFHSGISLVNSRNMIVSGNYIHDLTYFSISVSSRPNFTSDGIVVENNESVSTRGMNINQTRTSVADVGNSFLRNVTFRNNVSIDDYYSFSITNSTSSNGTLNLQNILVANNTLYNPTDAGLYYEGGNILYSNVRVYNNLLYNDENSNASLLKSGQSVYSSITTDYNFFDASIGNETNVGGVTRTLAQLNSIYDSPNANSTIGNAYFTNAPDDLTLTDSSDAIDAGIYLTEVPTGILGNPRSDPDDIGAYVYTGAASNGFSNLVVTAISSTELQVTAYLTVANAGTLRFKYGTSTGTYTDSINYNSSITASGTFVDTITGLAASTLYYILASFTDGTTSEYVTSTEKTQATLSVGSPCPEAENDLFVVGLGCFEDLSFNSWQVTNDGVINVVSDGGATNGQYSLKVTSTVPASASSSARLLLGSIYDLTSNLTVGESYTITYDARIDGTSVTIQAMHHTGGVVLDSDAITSTSYVTGTLTFTATHATNNGIYIAAIGAGEAFYLANVRIVHNP